MLLLLLLLLPACMGDDHETYSCRGNCEGVNIRVSLQGSPEVAISGTKSVPGNQRRSFNEISDLNVILFPIGGSAPEIYYFDKDSRLPDGLPLPLRPGDNASFTLHTTTDYASAEIYLVGNYGEGINNSLIPAARDLENLPLALPADNVPDKCVMFAKAAATGEEDGNGCRLLDANLERTLAMVTVSLDGTGLRDGVHIRPTKISIHNVPSTSRPGTDENKPDGADAVREGYSYIDTWGVLDNTTGTIGADTHTDADKFAFFLFENMQGTTTNTDEKNKKSNSVTMPYATYITVEAQYGYGNDIRGDVTYKFCLGANTVNDYNVRRNTHYLVTLSLNDWGGAEEGGRLSGNRLVEGQGEGVNWRVVMNLWDFGFPETDYGFDGNAEYGEIPLTGNSKFIDYKFIPDTDGEWILASSGSDWVSMSNGKGNASLLNNGCFFYFVKPWRFSDAGFPKSDADRQYRECHITIEENSSNMRQTVVFRQWAPVKIADDLYMERQAASEGLRAWGYRDVTDLPVGFIYKDDSGADDLSGYDNTELLANSPAAVLCRQRGGRDLSFVATGNTGTLQFAGAAYYLPSGADLDKMMNYEKDVFNPAHHTFEPLRRTLDYWSSSATNNGTTFYWDKAASSLLFVASRDMEKQVRCAYRPSKDQ